MPIISNFKDPINRKKIGDTESYQFVYLLLDSIKELAANDTNTDSFIDVIQNSHTSYDKGENLGSIVKAGGSEMMVAFSEDFTGPSNGECNDCLLEKYYRFYFTVLCSNFKGGQDYQANILLKQVVDYYRENIFCNRRCITIKVKENCYIEFTPRCHEADRASYVREGESLDNGNYLTATFRAKINFRWGKESDVIDN